MSSEDLNEIYREMIKEEENFYKEQLEDLQQKHNDRVRYLLSKIIKTKTEYSSEILSKFQEIKMIKHEIYEKIAKPLIKNKISNVGGSLSLFHKISTWECPISPFGLCLYDHMEDPAHDNCVFCGEPEERK